jgi:predicted RNA methylase
MISQNFPRRLLETCRLYKYDEELRNDDVEFQRVYEELKFEAALIMVVSLKHIVAAHVGL